MKRGGCGSRWCDEGVQAPPLQEITRLAARNEASRESLEATTVEHIEVVEAAQVLC